MPKKKRKDEGVERLRKNLQDEGLTPKDNPGGADEELHKEDAKPDKPEKPAKKEHEVVSEFDIKAGLNKYGFIHVPKKAVSSLPFDVSVSLKARIEGDSVVITKA